eukprot:gb/GECH01001960.1/.p1 GENE.gb/GECH01001960.1/~~gb/GECH01001960.1/.p1  ORF type:complete len:413 (+),score=90.56 gb/GECH01001960.1/:1-1239(+)
MAHDNNSDDENENDNNRIFEIQERDGNMSCADCLASSTQWASMNLGIFICIECSGVHRSLGTHISKVRSVDLDAWSPDMLTKIEKIGNKKSNRYWACNLLPCEIPRENDPYVMRHQHIYNKYVEQKYIPNNEECKPDRVFDIHLFNKGALHIKEKGSWRKRWFVQRENLLYFYKSENESFHSGCFEMKQDTELMYVEEIKNKCVFSIVFGPDNVLELASDTHDEVSLWMYNLRAGAYFHRLRTACARAMKNGSLHVDTENLRESPSSPSPPLSSNGGRPRANTNTNPGEKKGYLRKQGGSFKSMKRRFFILRNDMLYYFRTETDAEPLGEIHLSESRIIDAAMSPSKNPYSFNIHTPKRMYYICAESSTEKEAWMDAIDEARNHLNEDTEAAVIGSSPVSKIVGSSSALDKE